MTFVRPYSGTFTYKGIIPSAAMNILNTSFPNALDKTGDTVGTGGGVTGEIDFKSGSSLIMLPGSTIQIQGELVVPVSGDINMQSGSALVFQTGSRLEGDILIPGGTIVTNDGYISVTGSSASVEFGASATFQLDAGAVAKIYNTFEFESGSVTKLDSGSLLNMNPGSHVQGSLTWNTASIAPVLAQDASLTGTGKDFTILGQDAAAGGLGGNVVLKSGQDAVLFFQSAVKLQPAGTSGGVIVAYPFSGSSNTQRAINGHYLKTVTTAASGSPVTVINLYFDNSSCANVEVTWNRRTVTGGTVFGNKAMCILSSNSSGTIVNNTFTEYVVPSGGFDTFATSFTVSTSSNTLTLSANQIAVEDWQIVIQVNYN